MIEQSEVERLSTRVQPELVGVGRNGEAMARATQSPEPERASASKRESEGLAVRFEPNRYRLYQSRLTSGPRGKMVFSELV
jgi:hypothetical protein